MAERYELAEKMELIGQIFEIDGMSELMNKFDKGMTSVKFNAVVIQVSALLLKKDRSLSDKIIAMSKGIEEKEVQKIEDAEYAKALKDAIVNDVMGFFASSPSSDGKK